MTRFGGVARADSRSPLLIARFTFALFLLALLPSWSSFPATWIDGRSHGFAVVAYCLWLLWNIRHELRVDLEWLSPATLSAFVIGIVWLLSQVTGLRLFHQAAAGFLLLAWSSAVFGSSGFLRLWPIAAIFTLALPLWEVLLPPLQWMTVTVNHLLIRFASIPAELNGSEIRFPFGTIEVAQSCAGLSYLMSALTISVLYAHMFLRSGRARILAVLLAVTLSLISNWIRVFGLVLIGYRSRMGSPLMAEHAFYGWVIFSMVISFFFLLTGRIERWEAAHLLARKTGTISARRDDELISVRSKNEDTWRGPWPLLAGALVSLFGPLCFLLFGARDRTLPMPEPTPGIVQPVSWTVRARSPEFTPAASPWLPNMRGEHHRLMYLAVPPDSTLLPEVQIIRFGYDGNTQGGELIGGNNSISSPQALLEDRAIGPVDSRLRMVRQAIVRERTGARLVWYWYRVADFETPSAVRAKLLEIIAFFKRSGPSELVAVSAPCARVECNQAARAIHLVVTGYPLPADPTVIDDQN